MKRLSSKDVQHEELIRSHVWVIKWATWISKQICGQTVGFQRESKIYQRNSQHSQLRFSRKSQDAEEDRYKVDLKRSLRDRSTATFPLDTTPVLAAAPLPDASLHGATQYLNDL